MHVLEFWARFHFKKEKCIARGRGTGRACHSSVSHSTPLRGVSFQWNTQILLNPLINYYYSIILSFCQFCNSMILSNSQPEKKYKYKAYLLPEF